MVTIGANQNLEKIKEEVLAFAESMKDRELVILGHDNIDVDAVLSGILLSKLFNYLKIKNPVYLRKKSGFWLKNYAYSYQLLESDKAILWALPFPQIAQADQSEPEKLSEIEKIRERVKRSSPTMFAVILPKGMKKFQGLTTQDLSEIDNLPTAPTANQLNSIGLFEKK